jgi:hypothetical protein
MTTPLSPTVVNNGRVLDDIASLWHEDLQSGVVELTDGPSVKARLYCLINVSVEAHKIASSVQR